MRLGLAGLVLCCSGSWAAAEEAAPAADFFQQSWAAAAAQPLQPLNRLPAPEKPARVVARTAPVFAATTRSLLPKTEVAARPAMPAILLQDVPKPPERASDVTAFAAADAGAADDEPVRPIPRPVPRPGGIDQRMTAEPIPDDKPVTRVAMIAPGPAVAIGQLARMQPMAAIVKGACSVARPFKVSGLGPNGRTTLSPAATLDGDMVSGLIRWEAMVQAAARKNFGEPVVSMHVAASYACRAMNNGRRRQRLSEHAKANALDISGFTTVSGKEITVKRDFHGGGAKSAFLKDVRQATCGVFQVVLGPGSDGFHEDHLHMDLGRWKACR